MNCLAGCLPDGVGRYVIGVDGDQQGEGMRCVVFGGRLGLYRYTDMQDTIAMASGRKGRFGLKAWLTSPVWRYMRLLRKREYLVNTKPKRGIWKLVRAFVGFGIWGLGD